MGVGISICARFVAAYLVCRPNYFGLSTWVPGLNGFGLAHPRN